MKKITCLIIFFCIVIAFPQNCWSEPFLKFETQEKFEEIKKKTHDAISPLYVLAKKLNEDGNYKDAYHCLYYNTMLRMVTSGLQEYWTERSTIAWYAERVDAAINQCLFGLSYIYTKPVVDIREEVKKGIANSQNQEFISIAEKIDPVLKEVLDYYNDELRALTLFQQTLPAISPKIIK